MVVEIFGRIIMVIITFFSFLFTWWAPLIAMPVSFRIYDLFFASKTIVYHEKSKLVLDLLTHISYFLYFILCLYLCIKNIEDSLNWLIGIIIFLIVAQFLGMLWPKRWHFEKL